MAEVIKAGRADRGGKVTLNQHHEGSLGFQLSLAGFPGCRLLVSWTPPGPQMNHGLRQTTAIC